MPTQTAAVKAAILKVLDGGGDLGISQIRDRIKLTVPWWKKANAKVKWSMVYAAATDLYKAENLRRRHTKTVSGKLGYVYSLASRTTFATTSVGSKTAVSIDPKHGPLVVQAIKSKVTAADLAYLLTETDGRISAKQTLWDAIYTEGNAIVNLAKAGMTNGGGNGGANHALKNVAKLTQLIMAIKRLEE